MVPVSTTVEPALATQLVLTPDASWASSAATFASRAVTRSSTPVISRSVALFWIRSLTPP